FTIRAEGGQLDGEATFAGRREGVLELGRRHIPFFLARVGEAVEVWLGGKVYRFVATRPHGRSGAAGLTLPPGGRLGAPMPGLVLKVLAKPGDEVAAHAPLVIMESMKMEVTIAAPAQGRVAEVLCEAGSMVDVGAPLVRLEPEETP